MKTKVLFPALALLLALNLNSSCLAPVPAAVEPAVLRLSLAEATASYSPTRATLDPLDIGNYILTLTSAEGKTVFQGLWAERAPEFELEPGSYAVSLLSCIFRDPAYDSPQFGDVRSISLAEGQVADVELVVSQLNAGLRLRPDEKFVATYKEASLFIRSASGTLAFGYGETRTAFFQPGRVAVLLDKGGKTTNVYSLELRPGEIMTLALSVAESMPKARLVSGMDVSVRVDTVRLWTSTGFAWDGSSVGEDPVPSVPESVSVSAARGMAGSKDLWVCGYVVGGDLSSKSCSFEGPFSSRTNLVLADVPSCSDRGRCLGVQLAAGDIRGALNLVDNPSLLGRQVWLRGDVVESYYGIPGLQKLSDYRL